MRMDAIGEEPNRRENLQVVRKESQTRTLKKRKDALPKWS